MSDSSVVGVEGGPSRPVRLREAREAAGLHIAALAAALKVPVKKLEALEAGRYDELPDLTFARALASSACRQLKIAPGPVLDQIPVAERPALGDSPQAINAPFKGAPGTQPFNPAGWLSRPAVLGAIAVLLGAVVLVFLPARSPEPTADAVMPPGGTESATPSEVAPPPAAENETSGAASSEGTQTSTAVSAEAGVVQSEGRAPLAAVATGSGEQAVVSSPATAGRDESAQVVPAATSGTLLSIATTGDAWVEVVNGAQEVVVHRMLKAGDVLEFSTAPPYAVLIGRAEVAQVTVRGKPFDITPFARNSVARFEVK